MFPLQYVTLRRATDESGELWFIAKDICDYLEFASASDAYDRVWDEFKTSKMIETPSGAREMILISEPGMWQLTFQSRKPKAIDFQRMMYTEVLPQLRKNGYYRVKGFKKPVSPGNRQRYGRQPFLDVIRDRQVPARRAKEIMNALDIPGVPLVNTSYAKQCYGDLRVSDGLAHRAVRWLGMPVESLFTADSRAKLRVPVPVQHVVIGINVNEDLT